MSSNGSLTPVSVGTATITIRSYGGLSATQKVTVVGTANSLSLPSSLTISRGSTAKITATVSPNPTTSTITWKSSDPTVATVDSNGNVTGLKIGSTTITATTDNGLSSNCVVTVSAPLTEMAFVTPALTLFKGETYKLKLNIAPTDTTDTITYSSSSSSRATVSSTGVVTVGTSTGTVTITATSSNGMKATCTITVKNWPDVLVAVDSATTISGRTILTDYQNTTRITNLVKVKEGYTLRATPSSTVNGFNYYGTGATVDVLDDYGNVVITYTVAVNGDLNGDSFCDVLDAMLAQRYSTYVDVPTDAQICAAAGSTDASEIDVEAYQNVVNQVVS